MTLEYTSAMLEMAHEILAAGAKPYTDEQLKEIPRIINTKSRYFLAVDLNDYDILRDGFAEEEGKGFSTTWNGRPGAQSIDAQIAAAKATTDKSNMVPLHFAHNQIVRFIDDTHAQLLTRMHDYHTYKDNGDTYSGYGFYVDDLRKCEDGVWRITALRLDYGVLLGSLRR